MVDKEASMGSEALSGREEIECTDHLHVAQVLRDKLEAFIAGAERDRAGLRTVLDLAASELNISTACNNGTKRVKTIAAHAHEHDYEHSACGHFCSKHEELLNPSVWGNLPRELLPLIFARLPLRGVGRLRSISKEWRRSVDSIESDFSQALRAVNHTMLALISPMVDALGDFQVRIYDVKTNNWHCYEMHATLVDSITMGAADGGLVCFVSVVLDGPLSIVVINPFTLSWRNLPSPPHLGEVQPTMVHLSVDADTGKYKVMVAGFKDDGVGGVEIEVYDSETDLWIKPEPSERLCGYAYDWEVNLADNWFEEILMGPCVCSDGQLENIWYTAVESVWERPNVESYVLMKDRLFVLLKESRRSDPVCFTLLSFSVYCISEFEHNGTTWTKVANHMCDPFELCPKQDYKLSLHAACGFLMVFADIGTDPPFYHESGWLYNLSTRTWSDLPTLPQEYNFHADSCDTMCEIKWSAVP